jgi:diacylglycerol diphosphate phosphatase / phosphatidate phosphatase
LSILIHLILIIVQVWVAPHTFTRLFPVTFDGSGDIVFPDVAYPYVEPIFSSTAAGVLDVIIPIIVIVLSQLWIQSFHVMANGTLGLLYAVGTGTCFQVILKKTIGGLRPHFLSVCEPVFPLDGTKGVGFQNIMYTVEQVCTGDKDRIDNALESFPSGHSQIAWAGMGYLAIYLFCHLKIRNLSRCRPSHWRMLFVVAPLLFATYLAATLVLGYHHHSWDVIAGGIIGLTMAFLGYRICFASIWDPKWNTVPLTRSHQGKGGFDEEHKTLEPPTREHRADTLVNDSSRDASHV